LCVQKKLNEKTLKAKGLKPGFRCFTGSLRRRSGGAAKNQAPPGLVLILCIAQNYVDLLNFVIYKVFAAPRYPPFLLAELGPCSHNSS
jgi:hypothetical protein